MVSRLNRRLDADTFSGLPPDVRLIDAPGPVWLAHLPSDPLLKWGNSAESSARPSNDQPSARVPPSSPRDRDS